MPTHDPLVPPAFEPVTEGDLMPPPTYTLRPTDQDRRAMAVIARRMRPEAPDSLSMTAVVRQAVLDAAEAYAKAPAGQDQPLAVDFR